MPVNHGTSLSSRILRGPLQRHAVFMWRGDGAVVELSCTARLGKVPHRKLKLVRHLPVLAESVVV
jgi:hypothetical protein